MVDPDDKKFLELCLSRQLVDKKVATEAYHRARKEERCAAEVLVDMGALPRHTIEALKRELDLVLAPDAITGFRIIRKIGQGGMGAVYLAEQISLQREVALKVIAPQFSANAQAVDRFMREARTAAVVNHPNVISVIDVGYDGGHLYMALELVSGGDVAQLAARSQGVLPEIRALEIIGDCCRGLEALYEARLIHRDIKPANIFITRHGIAKLADLGLARSEQGDDLLTVFGHAVGTPAFMSPEQAGGKSHVDIRSDIYALGASLFSLTTGSPPFIGNGAYAVVAKLLTESAPDPRCLNPNLSAATSQIITRCLEKRPADRFQTPHDLSVAIAEVLARNFSTATGSATAPVIRPTTDRTTRSQHTAVIRPTTDRTTRSHTAETRVTTDRTARSHHTPPTARVYKNRPGPSKRAPMVVPWSIFGCIVAVIAIAVVAGMTMKSRPVAPHGSTSSLSGALSLGDLKAGKASPVVDDRAQVIEPSTRPTAVTPVNVAPKIAGLIAYWPLDEGTGLQAGDASGGKSTGMISGATWGPGKVGSAVVFSKPSKMLCNNVENLTPSGELTVMCWIKTRQAAGGKEPISVLRHDGHFTALQLALDGKAHVVTWGSGQLNMAAFSWNGVWDDDRWHHYAVTYHHTDGVKIYKDGQIYAQEKGRGALPAKASTPFVLGASELNCEYFIGSLDEVRIFDRQLSAAEIQTLSAVSGK